jgi:periplasmic protein TonB
VATTPNSSNAGSGGGGPRPLPPLFTKTEKYALTFLSIAFIVVSGLIHFAIGAVGESVVPHFKEEATPPPQKVTVQTLIKPPPKPTPTPAPTPTPTPPPPLKNTPPPINLKLHVVQSKSNDTSNSGPAEQAYTPPPVGNENGVPTAVPTVAPTAAATAAPAPAGPVTITDSEFIYKAPAEYPQLAQDQQVQGDVTVRITIGPQGQVVNVSIASSSGNPLLDNEALRAARNSRFKPPLVDGVPTQRDYLIVYTFRLDQ